MADVTFSVTDQVGLLTIDRPESANAFSLEMIDTLVDHLIDAQRRDDVRAVVLTGAGRRHFCAGGEVRNRIGDREDPATRVRAQSARTRTARVQRLPRTIQSIDKPVIAAVNGAAVGAGLDIALACDIRFASANATFAETYLRAGLIPGMGGSYFLSRAVGRAKAMELLLGGEFIDAAEALRIGLVNRVYQGDELIEQTLAFAGRIAASPPVHVQLIKRAIIESASSALSTSLELSASHMLIVQGLDDSREARNAYLEKRPGTYIGH